MKAPAQQSGRVTFDASEIALLAQKHLRLPKDQILIQQKTGPEKWETVNEVVFSVGAHPNQSGSTDTTQVRIAPKSGEITLVAVEFRVDGITADTRTADASTDLLTWLQKPTEEHYYSILPVTPRTAMLAGETPRFGFFFAAEMNPFWSESVSVQSTHYIERYARALAIAVPRDADLDDPGKEDGGVTGLERLARDCPIPSYVEFVTKGGPELLTAVNGLTAELLERIMQKATSEGIVPSEIALKQIREKRLKANGNPNPPNLQQYLAPFLAEKAAAAKSATPAATPVPTPQKQATPIEPATAPSKQAAARESSSCWPWIGGAAAVAIALFLIARTAKRRP
jgi:hypothetical protein